MSTIPKPANTLAVRVNLSPPLEELIQRKMASGFYRNLSELICEALERMEAQDQSHALQSEYLRTDIVAGLDSGKSGAISR